MDRLDVATSSPGRDTSANAEGQGEHIPPEALARAVTFTDQSSGAQSSFALAKLGALGGGTYGTCFQMRGELTGEKACAKFARRGDMGEAARASLRKEASTIARLDHPNIMKAIGLCIAADGALAAMLLPLCERNLQEWIEAHGPQGQTAANTASKDLGWAERSVLLQCAQALAHMHSRDVIHLDMKPENIMVDGPDGTPRCRIADFGQCRCRQVVDGIPDESLLASMVNSHCYRPLELYSFGNTLVTPRPRYDLWAFGCIMFEVAASASTKWRGTAGVADRLFQGITMEAPADIVLRGRNYRLAQYCPPSVMPLVLMSQPRSAARQDQTSATKAHSRLQDLRCEDGPDTL